METIEVALFAVFFVAILAYIFSNDKPKKNGNAN